MNSVVQILGVALGYLLATLVRYAGRSRFWSRVAESAQRKLDDPSCPDDPHEVAKLALVEAQGDSLNRIAKQITEKPAEISTDRPFEKHRRRENGVYTIVKRKDTEK